MKKTGIVLVLALALGVLLAGCGAATFTFTGVGNKTTIEVNNAEDGAYAESSPISVGKGRTAVVDSSLDKGELRIDFTKATVFTNEDRADDVYLEDVFTSITVGAGEHAEIPMEKGDYVLQITAVGSTNGKVVVDIKK